MNLIKIIDTDGGGTYLNKDNIIRVYRYAPNTKMFGIEVPAQDCIVAVQNIAGFPCVVARYDEGLWNNFLLSDGWIQGKDGKSIVNSKWVNSIVEYDDVYMVYVTENHYVNNGYISSRYLGIEITEREFSKLKRKEIE